MPSRWTSRVILRSLCCCPRGCWAGTRGGCAPSAPLPLYYLHIDFTHFIQRHLAAWQTGGAFWGMETSTGALGRCPHRGPPAAVRGSGCGRPVGAGAGGAPRGPEHGARSPLPGARCPLCLPPQHPEAVPSPSGQPRGAPGRGQQRSRSELRSAPGL